MWSTPAPDLDPENPAHRDCAHQHVIGAAFAAKQGRTLAQEYPNGVCASNHVGYEYPRVRST